MKKPKFYKKIQQIALARKDKGNQSRSMNNETQENGHAKQNSNGK